MTAQEASEWIVDNGGASLPARDEVDAYLIDELTSLGKRLIIHTEEDIPTKGPGSVCPAALPRIPIMTVCRTSLKINTALIRTIRQMP